MHGAENGALAAGFAECGNGGVEIGLGYIAEELFAEVCGHSPHLAGDLGVIIRQIIVA